MPRIQQGTTRIGGHRAPLLGFSPSSWKGLFLPLRQVTSSLWGGGGQGWAQRERATSEGSAVAWMGKCQGWSEPLCEEGGWLDWPGSEAEGRGWTCGDVGGGEAERWGGVKGWEQVKEVVSGLVQIACVCMGRRRRWGPPEPTGKGRRYWVRPPPERVRARWSGQQRDGRGGRDRPGVGKAERWPCRRRGRAGKE